MSVNTPQLWCAAPDLPPGTIKIAWRGKRGPESILIEGNAADSVMEQWRSAPGETEQHRLLLDLIEARAVTA